MPCRAKEAATSAIKASIGAPMAVPELPGPRSAANIKSALILLMNPPEGTPDRASPRGKSPLISIHYGGMVAREREETKSPQLCISPLCFMVVFMVVAPSKGICKKCSGMLNVLPYMVPVKRETQHLVARKC